MAKEKMKTFMLVGVRRDAVHCLCLVKARDVTHAGKLLDGEVSREQFSTPGLGNVFPAGVEHMRFFASDLTGGIIATAATARMDNPTNLAPLVGPHFRQSYSGFFLGEMVVVTA